MEHIVQFAIGIDDEAIRKSIRETAKKQIVEDIKRDLEGEIFHFDYYRKDEKLGLSIASRDIVQNVLEGHKNEIIELAAAMLLEYMKKTKAVREAVAETIKKAEE